MTKWLIEKLKLLTQEFQAGHGPSEVFEAFYLAYLECLQVAEGRDASRVWSQWTLWCQEQAGEGEPVQPMNRMTDRQGLITALTTFQRHLCPPVQARIRAPVPPETSPVDDLLDMFEVLGS